jgi:hypothetical protein
MSRKCNLSPLHIGGKNGKENKIIRENTFSAHCIKMI